jgi:hypothetical protein
MMDGSVRQCKERQMAKGRSLAACFAAALCAVILWAQLPGAARDVSGGAFIGPVRSAEGLSSSVAAERFYRIGYEIAQSPSVTGPQIDQAIILLLAAHSLDSEIEGIEPVLLELAIRHDRHDYSEQVLTWLAQYVDASADRVIVRNAIGHLLERHGSPQAQQALLTDLTERIGGRNAAIDSELATLMGTVMLEKGDADAAKSYLVQAYTQNRYNRWAFARLADIAPTEVGPAAYLEHLRLAVRETPFDLNAAMNFAMYCERLELFTVAQEAYRYCAELFRYLYPAEPLPPHIYLPWAINGYNADSGAGVCLQIAESLRNRGAFDIMLEAIAGRAAAKASLPAESQRILQRAEQTALGILGVGGNGLAGLAPVRQLNAAQMAWFHSFGSPNPDAAVQWANQAFSEDPNSASNAALLAYALSLKGRLEWAKPLLESFEHNQIADLVQAQLQAAEQDAAGAIQTLILAVTKDPGSLAAERARQMLAELGGTYEPPVAPEALTGFLARNLGGPVTPAFMLPDRTVDVRFNVNGSEFPYGADIDGVVTITNNGQEPLVITENGLVRGGLRVDAYVTGDLQFDVPNLIARTVRTQLEIAPGRGLTIPLRLSTGPLRQILADHPQASLDVQFALYLDPIVREDGSVGNRLADLRPGVGTIRRPGVDLTRSYVQNRFNAIRSGQQVQKIDTARLFAGLLKEQHILAEQGVLYPVKYADWIPNMLWSAFLTDSGLLLRDGRDDWVVKVSAMAEMLDMSADQELATAVAKNLNDRYWPVRLMAVYLLAQTSDGGFARVLDWVVQQDDNGYVRSMAVALQSAESAVSYTPPAERYPVARRW